MVKRLCGEFWRHKMSRELGYNKCVRCGTLGAGAPTEIRFWANVKKTDTCWVWTAYTYHGGYGQFRTKERAWSAHKYSWFLHTGYAPGSDVDVCHKCDNPPCVRPDHLFIGTRKENHEDMIRKGRKPTVLSLLQVHEIRKLAQLGRSNNEIAEYLHLTRDQVYRVTSGKCWKAIR